MLSRRAGKAVVLAVVTACAALSGCGGDSDVYAGLSEERARKEAKIFLEQEIREPTSPLHRHRVRMGRVRPGRNLSAERAWVASFSDLTTGGRFCVKLWRSGAKTLHAEFDRCTRAEKPPDRSDPEV
ncbi:MAG: hypothetical protein H0U03_08045 [Actinobacteria bacterium]|nr:hypothetical protein [Actinomycetota bacterium]